MPYLKGYKEEGGKGKKMGGKREGKKEKERGKKTCTKARKVFGLSSVCVEKRGRERSRNV